MRYFYLVILAAVIAGCSKVVIVSMTENDLNFENFVKSANRSSVVLQEEKIKLSVMNDKDFVYLFISPTGIKPDERSMGEGPLLTLNPGKKNSFGIQYPMHVIEFISKEKGNVNIREAAPSKPNENPEIGIFKGRDKIVKLSKEKAADIGIEAEWKEMDSQMGYFIKIPVNSNEKYPYAADPVEEAFTIAFAMNNMGPGKEPPGEGGGDRSGGGMGGGRPPMGGDDSFGSGDMPKGGQPMSGGGVPPTGGKSGRQGKKVQGMETVKITIKLKSED